MKTLNDLANDLSFTKEVEQLAQDLYSNFTGSGHDVNIARCWVLAIDSLISEKGYKLTKPALQFTASNVIKLRSKK